MLTASMGLAGCSDPCGALAVGLDSRCEKLCCDVAERLQGCIDDGAELSWSDVGAADRTDFARQCGNDWDRTSGDLTAYELQEATRVCGETRDGIDALDCEALTALYAAQP